MFFNQSEKSHDQKHVFQKGACLDDNLKSASPIHMKFCKYVRYIHVWKSITFRSDPIQNGRLINDLLNVTIFLNAEKTKTRVSP